MPRQRQLNLAVGFNPRIRGGNPRITSPPIVSRRVATDECHRQGASDTSRNPCGRDARAPRRVALATIEFSPAFQRRENGVTSPRVV
ncbi:hypothetical protein [Chloracidobacterium thermophilum]|uniref:hypothetical protein n=1 Tax=Chloracidobacterium thermophilum TaxID=458033 RepID=UPI0011D26197|nr:hypothetical protein [Chloracidobacterium thermophilum]